MKRLLISAAAVAALVTGLVLGRRTQSIAYNHERHQLIALTVNEQDEYVFVAYNL